MSIQGMNTIRNANVQRNIKRARLERGLAREKLAAQISVSSMTIWRWENDRRAIEVENFKRLCAALGHEQWWFFQDHGPAPGEEDEDPEPEAAVA